jgi:glycosyltransferase involved in cell wall biosynthesis
VALEGFGLIIVESLASGTPVLGTPVGAIPEILNGLDKRLVFPAVDVEAVAGRIKAVLDGQVVLPDRETCRAYAQQYAWPMVLPKLMEIFHEAIQRKKSSAL